MFSKYQTIEGWTLLAERMPDSRLHPRVLVFTEGYDFNGQQFFDVVSDHLNDAFFDGDMPEECARATHWMPLPRPSFGANGEQGHGPVPEGTHG